MTQTDQTEHSQSSAQRIALIYLVLGALWILFSDSLLESMVTDVGLMSKIQTLKGWFFVVISSAVIYLVALREYQVVVKTERASNLFASVDPLTGLPNAESMANKVAKRLAELKLEGGQIGLLLIDVTIESPDNLLRQWTIRSTANRLTLLSLQEPRIGTVGFLGNERFAIMVSSQGQETTIDDLKKQLDLVLAEPILANGGEIRLIYKVEPIWINDTTKSAEELLGKLAASA